MANGWVQSPALTDGSPLKTSRPHQKPLHASNLASNASSSMTSSTTTSSSSPGACSGSCCSGRSTIVSTGQAPPAGVEIKSAIREVEDALREHHAPEEVAQAVEVSPVSGPPEAA